MPELESLFLYITSRCNMRCPHCWVAGGDSVDAEIEIPDYLKVLDQANQLGLKRVKITGGEPLIREDVVIQLVDWCAEHSKGVLLETNGFFVRPHHSRWLRHIDEILVSLDYDEAKSFDRHRACEGAFNGAINAIEIALRSDSRVTVAMTVFDDNRDRIPAVASLLFDVLDLPVLLKLNPCVAVGRAKSGTILHPRNFPTFVRTYHDLLRQYPGRITASIPIAFSHPFAAPSPRSRCDFSSVLSVCPNGDLSICGLGITNPLARFGNVRQTSVDEVWRTDDSLRRLRCISHTTAEGVCSICIFRSACVHPCPAYSFDAYGDWAAPFPTCQRLFDLGLFPTEFLDNELPGVKAR